MTTSPPPRRPAGPMPVSRRNRKQETPAQDTAIRCEFCHAEIIWAYPTPSTKGRGTTKPPKPKPLDSLADDSGLFTIYEKDGKVYYGELTKGQAPGYRAAGNETYQAHFQTCVKSHEWGKLGKPYGTGKVTR